MGSVGGVEVGVSNLVNQITAPPLRQTALDWRSFWVRNGTISSVPKKTPIFPHVNRKKWR